jgi:hypothetical protein
VRIINVVRVRPQDLIAFAADHWRVRQQPG